MVGGTSGPALTQENLTRMNRVSRLGFIIFLRSLSLVVIAVAVYFWTRIIGLNGPDLHHVIEQDESTGVVLVVLAIAAPALGVGLWLGMSWGVILWAFVAIGLLAVHFGIQALPIEFYTFGAVLLTCLAFYCVALSLQYLIKLGQKRRRESLH